MECNKDEALRAQEIAEKKFKNRDFAGAKKLALKAQNLYPPLEGISQMLSTFDVHIAAETRVAGEIDWYGVLGITPTADDDTIRKQYQKLVLLLRPDKNKSVGADGAFRIILEAWNLLSDKAKRLAYNQRMQIQPQRPYSASNSNGVGDSMNSVPLEPTTQRNTFWTICMHCMVRYQYSKLFLNASLLCLSCGNVFMAREVMPPVPYIPSSQESRNNAPSSNIGKNSVATEKVRQGGSSRPNPTMAGNVKASNVYDQEKCRFKREREESQGSTLKGEASLKRRVLNGDDLRYADKLPFQMPKN
ncbi:hypothetical protein POM88_013328 [Heracleum sosnowskyi]|uniref:J domain-containing protein n=1 Tax=Heracleum sosnowskyi TaxID=360622 RepID=A0AAD8J1M0_9APIA|nr:hypothetical protein POM88_013328 [Heracleum sosnowskyi]